MQSVTVVNSSYGSLLKIKEFEKKIAFSSLVFMFLTLIFGYNFLFSILAICVHGESYGKKLVSISPNGSKVGGAVNPELRCTL